MLERFQRDSQECRLGYIVRPSKDYVEPKFSSDVVTHEELVANSRWFEDIAARHIAVVASTLPPDVVAAAQERGRARDLKATVVELLAELEC